LLVIWPDAQQRSHALASFMRDWRSACAKVYCGNWLAAVLILVGFVFDRYVIEHHVSVASQQAFGFGLDIPCILWCAVASFRAFYKPMPGYNDRATVWLFVWSLSAAVLLGTIVMHFATP
jgi:hypothetical protein